MMKWVHILSISLITSLCLGMLSVAHATRLKDISNFKGVRSNQLIGYGFKIRALGRVKDILDGGANVLVENVDSKKELVGTPISETEVRITY